MRHGVKQHTSDVVGMLVENGKGTLDVVEWKNRHIVQRTGSSMRQGTLLG